VVAIQQKLAPQSGAPSLELVESHSMRAWNRLPRAKQASVEAAAEHREGRVRTIQGPQRRLKSGLAKPDSCDWWKARSPACSVMAVMIPPRTSPNAEWVACASLNRHRENSLRKKGRQLGVHLLASISLHQRL
jgi:hypothetical protein